MNEKNDFNLQLVLAAEIERVLASCSQCGACVKNCDFLQRHGNPHELAESYKNGQLGDKVSFSCSLCRLCTAICPEKIDPARLLWLIRCNQVEQRKIDFRPYRSVLTYEWLGLTKLFSYFFIPENCKTVFFPGCALPGTRPAQFETVVRLLQKQIPDLGVVLACCAKPSHDLGRFAYFRSSFKKLHEHIITNGIETVLTACPSCHQVFLQYGSQITVKTIYQVLDEGWEKTADREKTSVTVHDPCNARFDKDVQKSVRSLLNKMGLSLFEMKHRAKKTFCCGEGGAAFCVDQDLAESWSRKRWEEAADNHMVSYCAGCTGFLGEHRPVHHIVDLLVDKKQALDGGSPVSRSPLTYLNRLKVKMKLKRNFT